ncbi:MAG TPA: hypothetical protein VGH37_06570, partial [Candidatus Acidoferrum sp.]
DDEGTDGLRQRLERILRLLSDTFGAEGPGSMDPTSVAIHDLEAVETWAHAVQTVAPTGSEHHSYR